METDLIIFLKIFVDYHAYFKWSNMLNLIEAIS